MEEEEATVPVERIPTLPIHALVSLDHYLRDPDVLRCNGESAFDFLPISIGSSRLRDFRIAEQAS